MSTLSLIRHQHIFNPLNYDHVPINIVGCGATGSRVFMSLIELGLTNIRCFDFDTVEEHNIANQAFMHKHIGMTKVDALADLYRMKVGLAESDPLPDGMEFNCTALPLADADAEYEGIVFLLTDTMASRKDIYEGCIKDNFMIPCVVETRMATTHGNSFCFDPNDPDKAQAWIDSLIDDGEAEVSPCGSPLSVGNTAAGIASLAVWQFMCFMLDDGTLHEGIDIFFKPFFTSHQETINV